MIMFIELLIKPTSRRCYPTVYRWSFYFSGSQLC